MEFRFSDYPEEIQKLSQMVGHYESFIRRSAHNVRQGYGAFPGTPIVNVLLKRTRAVLEEALSKHLTEEE